jgi:hypothetical protein
MKKMLAVALLGTLPLMASMCGGSKAPEPETDQSAPPVTQPPATAPVCTDSISLEVTEGPFLRTLTFGCRRRNGMNYDASLYMANHHIINTQDEYEKMVSCGSNQEGLYPEVTLPKVDFAKHTLLMGEMVTPVFAFPRNIKFSKACDEYRLNLNLWPGASAQVVSVSSYFVLVPKLPEGAKMKFNVYSKFCLSPVGDCP